MHSLSTLYITLRDTHKYTHVWNAKSDPRTTFLLCRAWCPQVEMWSFSLFLRSPSVCQAKVLSIRLADSYDSHLCHCKILHDITKDNQVEPEKELVSSRDRLWLTWTPQCGKILPLWDWFFLCAATSQCPKVNLHRQIFWYPLTIGNQALYFNCCILTPLWCNPSRKPHSNTVEPKAGSFRVTGKMFQVPQFICNTALWQIGGWEHPGPTR